MQHRAEAEPVGLARGLGQQLALLCPVEPQHGGQHAGAAAGVGAEGDVLQHRAARQQADVLEGAPQPEPGHAAGRLPVTTWPWRRMLPASGVIKPLSWLNMVLLPAPFGPISATI